MKNPLRALFADDAGQDLAEYGIALAVISVAIVLVVGVIATDVQSLWTIASGELSQVVAQVGN